MTELEEPGAAARFCLVGVHREGVVVAPTRVRDMIRTPAEGPAGGCVHEIEDERGVNRDGGVKAARRLPGAIADAAHELTGRARRLKR